MSPSEASGERRPGRLHLKPTQADLEHAEWRQRKKERRKRKRAERAAKGYPESDEGSTKSSKSFKSSSTSRHHGHHRRREDGGRGRSNSPSTSSYGSRARHHPAPDARFGDNLFEAERAQAAEAEERIWAQKLADLASEDVGGAGEFGRVPGGMAGDELGWDDGEQEPYLGHVPKRWRDEGLAYAKKGAGLHDMDDEHYAEYMREGMYRRTHASEIAAQEASLRQAREKAARAAQASAATRAQDEARAARRRAEQRAEERSRAVEELRTAREEYERKWNELRANGKRNGKDKAKDDDDDEQGPLYFSDLPWPTMPAGPGRALSLSKDAISHFLLSATTPDKTTDDPRTRLRAALLSYHPDRYLSAGFFKRVPEEGGQRDRVRECVNRVAQVLGELMDGVRQRESKEKEMGAKGGKG